MKILITVLIILLTPFSYADNKLDFFAFTTENDFFVRDDGLYSSGFIASWGYDDIERLDKQTLPDWLDPWLVPQTKVIHTQSRAYVGVPTYPHLTDECV